MKIGYAMVSTRDQNLELQIDALNKYGCEQLFQEKQSAVKERPELEKMLSILRKGDEVVVWKLDRLGRSLLHLVDLVTMFNPSCSYGGKNYCLSMICDSSSSDLCTTDFFLMNGAYLNFSTSYILRTF